MPGTPTTRYGLPTMAGTDIGNTIDEWTVSLGAAVDPLLAPSDQGLLANRPTSTGGSPSNKPGRTYWATDTKQLFRDNGSGWDEIVAVPAAAQTWQTIALGGGAWSGVPDALLRYYKNALREVVMRGDPLTAPVGGVPAGTLLCTLPAGFRPGSKQYVYAFRTDDANITNSRAILSIDVNGDVVFVGTGAGGSMGVAPYTFSAVRFRAEN